MSVLLHDLDKLETGVYFLSVDKNDEDVPMYILGQGNGCSSTFVAFGRVDSVPPHGRLIDADAFVDKHFGKEFLSKVMTADKDDLGAALVNIPLVINNAPTIIQAEEEMKMSDWRTQAVEDFCRENNVTVIVEDEWKTRENKVVLRKGKHEVVRRICYDSIPTLLPTALLNQMLHEIPAEEGE